MCFDNLVISKWFSLVLQNWKSTITRDSGPHKLRSLQFQGRDVGRNDYTQLPLAMNFFFLCLNWKGICWCCHDVCVVLALILLDSHITILKKKNNEREIQDTSVVWFKTEPTYSCLPGCYNCHWKGGFPFWHLF